MNEKATIRLVGDRVERMRDQGQLNELLSEADLAKADRLDEPAPDQALRRYWQAVKSTTHSS